MIIVPHESLQQNPLESDFVRRSQAVSSIRQLTQVLAINATPDIDTESQWKEEAEELRKSVETLKQELGGKNEHLRKELLQAQKIKQECEEHLTLCHDQGS